MRVESPADRVRLRPIAHVILLPTSRPCPPEDPASGPVHRPVLLDEVVAWLAPAEGSVLVDGTVGAGGHAAALARRVGATGRVIGLDRDPAMLALAERGHARACP